MKNRFFLTCFCMLCISVALATPPLEDGRTIFSSRCASCHNVNKVVVGPALAGVSERRSEDWILRFVHSSQTVIKSGDTAATALYEKFNKVPMPDHPDLTADNIKNILAYIKSETKTSTEAPAFRPDKVHPNYTPISAGNWLFFMGYGVLVLLLAASLILLVRVKEIERKSK